jgi:hypothetical protein
MAETTMPASTLRQLVSEGADEPLLSGADVGPTWYAGQWWFVPSDALDDTDYQLADEELSRQFDDLRRRAARIAEVSGEEA